MSDTIDYYRHVGDSLTPIGATITLADGTARDLTGLTVNFVLYDSDGAVAIAEDTATVVSASAGTVQYNPGALAAGTYYGYFRVVSGSDKDSYPARLRKLRIFSLDPATAAS